MVNTVSQIIKGSGTYPVDVSTFDVTISPTLSDTTKAIVMVSFATSDINDHAFTFRSYEILNTTTLRLYGRGDLAFIQRVN